jgi:Trp operon repressor
MNLFANDDDFMNMSPKDKLFEIIFTANKDVVENELQNIFNRLTVMEKLLEEKMGEDELEQKVNETIYGGSMEFEQETVNFAMGLMAKILSQAE